MLKVHTHERTITIVTNPNYERENHKEKIAKYNYQGKKTKDMKKRKEYFSNRVL